MKKPRKKKSRAKRLLRSFIILVVFAAGIISFCLFTPIFNISRAEVRGCEQLTAEQVEAAAQIEYGKNIFQFNTKAACEKILALPQADTVKISRRPLSVLKITVTETYPALAFSYMDGAVITNSAGKAMELCQTPDSLTYPLIKGIDIENIEISKKIAVQDTIKFDIIIANVDILRDKGILDELASVDFSDLSSAFGYLHNGVKVIFGKLTDLDYKISMLMAVLPQIDATPGAYIDLTNPQNAFYGREEEKPAAEPTATAVPENAPSAAPTDGQ